MWLGTEGGLKSLSKGTDLESGSMGVYLALCFIGVSLVFSLGQSPVLFPYSSLKETVFLSMMCCLRLGTGWCR
jgi:hypothetical protein